MSTRTDSDRYELLDDGFAPPSCEVLVIGCGNILRGDDAVGPILVRHLWDQGVPDKVRMVDGGTAGMDVSFQMRGASKVVIVDASETGAEPGTLYRVPGREVEQTGPVDGLHTHSFRWDHALSFGRWLLGPEMPTDVTVFLIEAGNLTPGAELSEPVRASMERAAELIRAEFFPTESLDGEVTLEVTDSGYLRVPAAVAMTWFPAEVCGLAVDEDVDGERALLLMPLRSQANGGQLLKRRNLAGDRVVLVREALADDLPVGEHPAHWDQGRGALVVPLRREHDERVERP